MALPNFTMQSVISKHLEGVEVCDHVAMTNQHARNYTYYGWRHSVNVRVPDYGVFELRWLADSKELDTLSRRWLATQVYYHKQRNKIGKAA